MWLQPPTKFIDKLIYLLIQLRRSASVRNNPVLIGTRMIEFDNIKKRLHDCKEHGIASHSVLKTTGMDRGKKSQPLKSHNGFDIVELEVHNALKSLNIDTISTYKDAVTLEHNKIHPNLIKIKLSSEETADLEFYDIPTEDPNNTFSNIIQRRRSVLIESGKNAVDSFKKLTQFKERNVLSREAEYPVNRIKYFLIIGGVVLMMIVLMFVLLSSQESDSTFNGILVMVLLIVAINTGIGIISSECLRAYKHQADALRITSKAIFIVVIVFTIFFNLGIGHYRDALDADYPTVPISETTNDEIPQIGTEDSISQTPTEDENVSISTEDSSPSSQAITLLFRKFFLLNELHSYILTILGFVLFGAVIWLAWKSDDEYFQYGQTTRQYKRSIAEWNTVHEKIINDLNNQYNRIHENLQSSRINFVEKRELIITHYDNFSAEAIKLIQQIKDVCIDSIEVYRTANQEVRPKLPPAPDHWDDNIRLNWDEFIPSRIDFLCSQEEALTITQQRDEEIINQITDLKEIFKNYLYELSTYGPITKKS